MATITSSETLYAIANGGTVRYRFRYVLDTGESYERNAWVPAGTDEATERVVRGAQLLADLAEVEFEQIVGAG